MAYRLPEGVVDKLHPNLFVRPIPWTYIRDEDPEDDAFNRVLRSVYGTISEACVDLLPAIRLASTSGKFSGKLCDSILHRTNAHSILKHSVDARRCGRSVLDAICGAPKKSTNSYPIATHPPKHKCVYFVDKFHTKAMDEIFLRVLNVAERNGLECCEVDEPVVGGINFIAGDDVHKLKCRVERGNGVSQCLQVIEDKNINKAIAGIETKIKKLNLS